MTLVAKVLQPPRNCRCRRSSRGKLSSVFGHEVRIIRSGRSPLAGLPSSSTSSIVELVELAQGQHWRASQSRPSPVRRCRSSWWLSWRGPLLRLGGTSGRENPVGAGLSRWGRTIKASRLGLFRSTGKGATESIGPSPPALSQQIPAA